MADRIGEAWSDNPGGACPEERYVLRDLPFEPSQLDVRLPFSGRGDVRLVCILISVSMETPNTFSILSAISAERLARSLRSADSAGRVHPLEERQAAATVTRQRDDPLRRRGRPGQEVEAKR